MKELLDDLARWRTKGRRVVVARVVDVQGSGPRQPSAAMAVSDTGEVAGSVSGGCVEGAVVTEALALLEAGAPGHTVSYGYSDDDAFAVGLTCGGTVHLFLDELVWSPVHDRLAAETAAGRPVALATVVEGRGVGASLLVVPGEGSTGALGDEDLDRVVARDAAAELELGRSSVRHYGPRGEAGRDDVTVFVESFAASPRMFAFGAVDFTAALVRVAKVLGYEVTVCDAREAFATRTRFPEADEVLVDWPHRLLERIGPTLGAGDAVCVLTHDHKFDVPAIRAALATEVGYIGAMGSRRTHDERLKRLEELGVDPVELTRLRGPIGLDLGARTPEETAVSICAEIIATRSGRSARPLRELHGPIHPPTS